MIKLTTLKESKNLSEIIPDIIEAFDKNPNEETVRITNSEGKFFKISRFDIDVYQALPLPKMQDYYLSILVQKQFCMQCNEAVLLADLLATIYNMIRTDAVNDYLAHFMSM